MASGSGVLAVDLGGTHLRVAAIGHDGGILLRESIPTYAERGWEQVLDRMGALCNAIAERASLSAAAPVGIASPGPLDPRTGVVLFTPNLPNWLNVPLGPRLAELTGRPVRTSNDANCAALGEARFGAGKGLSDIVYLGLGTGIGGGLILGGRLYEGGFGMGAELGHVVVDMGGPRCHCGSVGCLEAYLAGWAIAGEGHLVALTADGAGLRELAAGEEISGRVIAQAAGEGDPAAIAIYERAGRALGAAMGSFVNTFNPQATIIGGGASVVGELLLGPARRALAQHAFRMLREPMEIRLATLGDDNGLIGAGALALDHWSRL